MTPEQEKRFDEFYSDSFGTGKEPIKLEQLFNEPPLDKVGKRAINEFLEKLTGEYSWQQKQEFVRRFIVEIASQFEANDLLPWNEMSIAIRLQQKLIAKQGADNQGLQEQIEQLRGEITGMAAQLNALELMVADLHAAAQTRIILEDDTFEPVKLSETD